MAERISIGPVIHGAETGASADWCEIRVGDRPVGHITRRLSRRTGRMRRWDIPPNTRRRLAIPLRLVLPRDLESLRAAARSAAEEAAKYRFTAVRRHPAADGRHFGPNYEGCAVQSISLVRPVEDPDDDWSMQLLRALHRRPRSWGWWHATARLRDRLDLDPGGWPTRSHAVAAVRVRGQERGWEFIP